METVVKLKCSFDPNDYILVGKDAVNDLQITVEEEGFITRVILDKEKALELANAILNTY